MSQRYKVINSPEDLFIEGSQLSDADIKYFHERLELSIVSLLPQLSSDINNMINALSGRLTSIETNIDVLSGNVYTTQ